MTNINKVNSENLSKTNRLIVPRLSIMMFLEFFIWGSWSVTLGVVMTKYNLTILIGDAFSAQPIASILSPFVLGMVVDRFFSSQKVLATLHLLGSIILWFIPNILEASNGVLLIWSLFIYTLFYMPTVALTNNIAFHSLDNSAKSFPIVRVFGTIGWIVAGICIGQASLSDSAVIFYVASISSVILGIYSITLPHTPAPAKGQPLKIRDLLCADAFALLKKRHFLVFIVCATLISIPLGTYYAYTAPFLAAIGFDKISTIMSLGQMSEIIFMLLIPLFFRRLGIKYMLLIGMLAWFFRYIFFAIGIPDETRWLIYIGILLHGVCYDFFFVIGFIYTDRVAGNKVKGQAQSLVVLFTYGVGMLLGSQISGALFNYMFISGSSSELATWKIFWWIPAIAAVLIAIIFSFAFKYTEKE